MRTTLRMLGAIGAAAALTATAQAQQFTMKLSSPVVNDSTHEYMKVLKAAVEERSKGKIKVVKLNIDENPTVASKLGIRSIPTLIIFKDGKAAAQKVGAAPKGSLEVATMLERAADGLVAGGKKGIFTPLFFFLARKPL